MKTRMPLWLAVAIGSALGALARAGLGVHLAAVPPAWPWGTWIANAAGSFLIVLVATLSTPEGRLQLSPALQHGIMAGFCGGFTTFSIFSLESLELWNAGAHGLAATYVGVSLLIWLLAGWLGWTVGRRLAG